MALSQRQSAKEKQPEEPSFSRTGMFWRPLTSQQLKYAKSFRTILKESDIEPV
jgi:hypothetical protein